MARDISIAISARDNYSSTITTIRNSNRNFNKDLEETQRHIQNLEKRQDSLKSSLAKSQTSFDETSNALKAAKKAFAGLNDEANRTKLDKAHEEYNRARQDVKDFETAIKDTRKEINGLNDDINRSENRVGGIVGSKSGAEAGLASSLAKAGLFKMAGDSLSGMVNAGISSAFGNAAGETISTTLSGAITGAAMGSMIPVPILGTAIGAAIGTAAGGISAATGYFQKQDDIFISEVQQQINRAGEEITSSLDRGIQLSGQWASNLLAFNALLSDGSEEFLEDLRKMDAENPFDLAGLATQSKLLMTSGVDRDDTLRTLSGIGNAAAITGMSTQDMNQVAETIGYMGNLANITKRQTDIFTMRGIPIIDYLADALQMSTEDVYSAMSKGDISGKDAQRITIDYLEVDPRFAGAAQALMSTLAGSQSALNSQYELFERSMGSGFESAMIPANNEDLSTLNNGLADALSRVYFMAGQGEAERKALERKYLLDARNYVFNNAEASDLYNTNQGGIDELTRMRNEYHEADRNGDNMTVERILKEVEAFASISFQDSPEMKALQDSQTDLVKNTQDILNIHKGYTEKVLAYQEQISKGIQSVNLGNFISEINITGSQKSITGRSRETSITPQESSNPRSPYSGKAFGMPYIPYDDYIIRAHQGERLLTASEARAQDSGKLVSPIINIHNPVVREEPDIDKIARMLAYELHKARLIM